MDDSIPIHHGRLKPMGSTAAARLMEMFHDLLGLMDAYGPEEMTFEKILLVLHGKNGRLQNGPRTVEAMAGATLICKMAAARAGIPYYEVAPSTVKLAATGNGRAGKSDVWRCVAQAMGVDYREIIDDNHADALAQGLAWGNPTFRKSIIEARGGKA